MKIIQDHIKKKMNVRNNKGQFISKDRYITLLELRILFFKLKENDEKKKLP